MPTVLVFAMLGLAMLAGQLTLMGAFFLARAWPLSILAFVLGGLALGVACRIAAGRKG